MCAHTGARIGESKLTAKLAGGGSHYFIGEHHSPAQRPIVVELDLRFVPKVGPFRVLCPEQFFLLYIRAVRMFPCALQLTTLESKTGKSRTIDFLFSMHVLVEFILSLIHI